MTTQGYMALKVYYEALPAALDELYYNEPIFKAHVSNVRFLSKYAIVLIKMKGHYPYMTDKWKTKFHLKHVVEEEE